MRKLRLTLGFASFALMAACGAGKPSAFDSSAPEQNAGDSPGVLGGADGEASQTPEEFQGCATKTTAAEAKPVYLVFMFDKSESMAWNGSPKWPSAAAASTAFFESPESLGVRASLSFFPNEEQYSCDPSTYAKPEVAMTALPNATFRARLDAQTPIGGTPTYVALQGAINYAQRVAENEGKDGNVAIVLVTDGLPDSDCSGNSVSAVRDLAASVAQSLPTYVIGVGDQLTSLKDIALAGGTKSAFIVKATNATQIQQDFLSAVNTIKASALACDYEIPSPPPGEQLDRAKVNVVYSPAGSNGDPLSYNPLCANGVGWHYDRERDPTRIVLCSASCDVVKAKPGRVDVLFGCATKGSAVK